MSKTVGITAAVALAASAGTAMALPAHSVNPANMLPEGSYSLQAYDINTGALVFDNGVAVTRGTPTNVQYDRTNDGPGANAINPLAGTPSGAFVDVDDYNSIAGGVIDVSTFNFIGGVDVAGAAMFFAFFDSASSFVDSFGVLLPSSGFFNWTINIGGFPGGVFAPGTGSMATIAVGGVDLTGDTVAEPVANTSIFIEAGPAAIGSTAEGTLFGSLDGNGDPGENRFSITGTPAPGTLALLGLSGLVATRRRR